MDSTAMPPWTSHRLTPSAYAGSPGLGLRALPYAFSLHGEEPPGDIRTPRTRPLGTRRNTMAVRCVRKRRPHLRRRG